MKSTQPENFIRIQDLFYLCLAKWKWFVISLLAALFVAFSYIQMTPPLYVRTASVLINDDKNGSASGNANVLAEMGVFQPNSDVYKEMVSMRSSTVMEDVVSRLGLDVGYTVDGAFYRRTLYGTDLPFHVSFQDLGNNDTAELTVQMEENGAVALSGFSLNGVAVGENKQLTAPLDKVVNTPLGKLLVASTPAYKGGITSEMPVLVQKQTMASAVKTYLGALTVALGDEKASVVDISVSDVSVQRAEDVVNTLISAYNDNWVKSKNQIAVSTSMFIDERLAVIERELGNVDSDISSYKSKNLLPDVQAASSMYVAQSNEAQSKILALTTQLAMARYVRKYTADNASKNQLLPANSGIESGAIESQIAEYNLKQLQRNELVATSSEQNPLVVNMDKSLNAQRQAIIASIDNLVVSLNTQIASLQKTEQQTTERIAENPMQAKFLLSVERQQKVKEALYLFLLQKREENELSQAFTAYNTQVLKSASGSNFPIAPLKKNILMVAVAIGLIIPVLIIFLMENANTKVRGRKDVESLTLPFVGEIPLSYKKKKTIFARKKEDDMHRIVVKERSRNVVNEAFRIVRTNLEFMTGKGNKSKIVMLTSMNPGSGKTFISANLAMSFAVKGKKVLAIDLDLRKASLSSFVNSPRTGISNLLNGEVKNVEDILVRGKLHPNLDIVPVGTLPPNPTELLFDARLQQLLEEMQPKYDCIFIDCPPVEIVADAAIINKHVDMTLFIVRAELLDRSMLPDIERFYTEQKYHNMALLLNGTVDAYAHYGYHRYGYRYGYNYGYGSGYDENE